VVVSANPLEPLAEAELDRMITVVREAIAEETAIGSSVATGDDGDLAAVGRAPALIDAE
jgi:hypothetical protein